MMVMNRNLVLWKKWLIICTPWPLARNAVVGKIGFLYSIKDFGVGIKPAGKCHSDAALRSAVTGLPTASQIELLPQVTPSPERNLSSNWGRHNFCEKLGF